MSVTNPLGMCHGRDCTKPAKSTRALFCSEKCRKSQYAATCVDCGAPTSGSEGRREVPRCSPCGTAAVIAAGDRSDMRRHADRESVILVGWGEGDTMQQIAARLDSTAASIAVDIDRMRKRGVDVPYRQQWSRPKAAREATPCQ